MSDGGNILALIPKPHPEDAAAGRAFAEATRAVLSIAQDNDTALLVTRPTAFLLMMSEVQDKAGMTQAWNQVVDGIMAATVRQPKKHLLFGGSSDAQIYAALRSMAVTYRQRMRTRERRKKGVGQ